MRVEDAEGLVCALEVFAELDELPAFVMRHRGVTDALQSKRPADDSFVEFVRRFARLAAKGRVAQEPVEFVQFLPGPRIDGAADAAGVVPRPADAGHDAVGIGQIEGEPVTQYDR